MQFKTLFSVALFAGAALSAQIERRQAAPIVDALTKIDNNIKKITGEVAAWSGDPVAATGILNEATDLLAMIDSAGAAARGVSPLVLNEAVKILQPGNAIIADTAKIVDALVTKKPDFDKSSLSSVVKETLTKFQTSSAGLLAIIKTKLPANVQSVGDSIGKQITSKLAVGLSAYA